MKAIGISNPYTSGKVYIIWDIPHDKINGFEVYRDNKLIATSFSEEGLHVFIPPTMFDHDHHTNLFKKILHISSCILMKMYINISTTNIKLLRLERTKMEMSWKPLNQTRYLLKPSRRYS